MKNAELIKTIANINKKYGDGTVVLGSDIIEQPPRFTSGSLALDVSLGGGWPANQWHCSSKPKSKPRLYYCMGSS